MTRSTPPHDSSLQDMPVSGNGFAARPGWQQAMAAASRKALRSRRDAESWEIWGDYLDDRKSPPEIAALLPGKCWPPAWSIPNCEGQPACKELLATIKQLLRTRRPPRADIAALLRSWLDDPAQQNPDAVRALEAVAWCHALPRLSKIVSSTTWWDLFEELLRLGTQAARTRVQDEPLVHQLLAGELPLTLAYLLPEMPSCRKLAGKALDALSRGLTGLLHGDGILHARQWDLFGPLLGCWTRSVVLCKQMQGGCWAETVQQQYDRFVRNLVRLRRADGSPVLSHGPGVKSLDEPLAAALRQSDDEDNRRIAAFLAKGARRTTKKPSRGRRLPEAAFHLESAATAVLRSDWSKSREWLAVAYPDQSVNIELNAGSSLLWSGRWEFQVQCDGRPAEPTGNWEEVCWLSDERGCYLELEMRLGEGLRLQRQFLLAAQDRFLYMADVILGRRPGRLSYRGCLPLAEGVTWQGQNESREGFLQGPKSRVLGLPLALPEWRATRGLGELHASAQGLELCQSDEGSCLLAPLFFDFDPRRVAHGLTWRQLTVAENRVVTRRDVAAGYRVMIGNRQWLIYRALARKGNRTLLGHNLSSEMMIGRFTKDGIVEPVVEVD